MPRQRKQKPSPAPRRKVATRQRMVTPKDHAVSDPPQDHAVTDPPQDHAVTDPQDHAVTDPPQEHAVAYSPQDHVATSSQQDQVVVPYQASISGNYEVWRSEAERTINLNEVCRHFNVTTDAFFNIAQGHASSLNPNEAPSNFSTTPVTTLLEEEQAGETSTQPNRSDINQNSDEYLNEEDRSGRFSPYIEPEPTRRNPFQQKTPTRSSSFLQQNPTARASPIQERHEETQMEAGRILSARGNTCYLNQNSEEHLYEGNRPERFSPYIEPEPTRRNPFQQKTPTRSSSFLQQTPTASTSPFQIRQEETRIEAGRILSARGNTSYLNQNAEENFYEGNMLEHDALFSSYIEPTPNRKSPFQPKIPSKSSSFLQQTPTRNISFLHQIPTRSSSFLQQTPTRNISFLQQTPTRNNSFLQQTPTRSNSFLQQTPSRSSSFLLQTPSRSTPPILLNKNKGLNTSIDSEVGLIPKSLGFIYAFPSNLFGHFRNFLWYVWDTLYDIYSFL